MTGVRCLLPGMLLQIPTSPSWCPSSPHPGQGARQPTMLRAALTSLQQLGRLHLHAQKPQVPTIRARMTWAAFGAGSRMHRVLSRMQQACLYSRLSSRLCARQWPRPRETSRGVCGDGRMACPASCCTLSALEDMNWQSSLLAIVLSLV